MRADKAFLLCAGVMMLAACSGDTASHVHGEYLPYYSTLLDSDDSLGYMRLRRSLLKGDTVVKPDSAADSELILRIMQDDPMLFNIRAITPAEDGTYEVTYRLSENDCSMQYTQVINKAAEITAAADGLSDYEKLVFFHDTIIDGCIRDMDGLYTGTAYDCLIAGRSDSKGYAMAMAMLCENAGIDCACVSGTFRGRKFVWNKAVCDGVFCNIDCAADDDTADFQKLSSHRYFMRSDEEFSSTHEEYTFTLSDRTRADDDSKNYFAVNDLVADSVDSFARIYIREGERAVNSESYNFEVMFSPASLKSNAENNKRLYEMVNHELNFNMGELTSRFDYSNIKTEDNSDIVRFYCYGRK